MRFFSKEKVKEFQGEILGYYQKHRRSFPWRNTRNPYRILVSEIMLQQTQVNRVAPHYRTFLKRFPDVFSLARASVSEVVRMWQGLGYNRRALNLHRAAQYVVEHGGTIPDTIAELEVLPGVGTYTAAAVSAFAFNKPSVLIETNIRTVFLHFFFPTKKKVADVEIISLVEQTLNHKNPREWYQALMDYGSMLKQSYRLNERSTHYVKQKPFPGSHRQLRGELLRLAVSGKISNRRLEQFLVVQKFSRRETTKTLKELVSEGFLEKSGFSYQLR